uniref:Leucine-rich repeat-containing N-terminal plant-type domain-containing protein n=1 Tax=Fagus sylvatica TaxID=28930 RepID=A0A2N9HBJ0_FAGSY
MASFLCYLMSIRLLFLLPLFHAIATDCFASMQPLCHDDESSALLQFKESFVMSKNACIDPSGYPKIASWKLEGMDRDCCSWDGVECDDDTGHVIGLDLSSSCLYGSMVSNSSLFRLVQLQRLNLAYNDFNFSQIPSGFSQLFNYVQISSPVPEILSNLSCLTILRLSGCGLHGEFPVGIFKLPKLRELKVGYNQDLTGYLPQFDSSSPLEILWLLGTSFFGKLPASIGNLDSLNELWIGSCNFSGHIPPSLGNLTTLESLDLSQNKLSGWIPWQLTQLTFLESFNVSHNQLTGPIPHGKQFDTFDNSSFDGNLGLCGNPLSKKCENPEPTPLPTSSFEEDQDSWFHIEFDWKIILMGYGSGLVIGVVVGNIVAEKIRTWKRQHKRGRSRITLFTIY